MICPNCGAENPDSEPYCQKCAVNIEEMEQQAEGVPLTLLGAAPGIILFYLMGLAVIYDSRKYGGIPDSRDWLLSAICAVLATVLLGVMVYRSSMSRSDMTGSWVPTIFVSVSSACIATVGLIVLFWNELDLQYDRDAIALSIMAMGLVQGTVTAIEWNRLRDGRGVWRILSMVTATPAYLFAIAVIYWEITLTFGCSSL